MMVVVVNSDGVSDGDDGDDDQCDDDGGDGDDGYVDDDDYDGGDVDSDHDDNIKITVIVKLMVLMTEGEGYDGNEWK